MEAIPGGFALEIARDVAGITVVLDRLEAFGRAQGLPDTLLSQCSLALDELLANIIGHGSAAGGHGPIDIGVTLDARGLHVEVSDGGPEFDPFARAPTPDRDSPLEQRRVGGLGIHLIRAMMDQVRYRRDGDRNIVGLFKAPPAPDHSDYAGDHAGAAEPKSTA